MNISQCTLTSSEEECKTPEEEKRLNTILSEECCPECGGNITLGEYSTGGVCTTCYFLLHEISGYET